MSWQTFNLGDLVDVYDGPHATPKTTDRGPIFLGIDALDKGRLNLESARHVSEADYVAWTRRITPTAGDVVFSYETRLGEAALIPDGLVCCLGRRMGLMRAKAGRVDPHFLLYRYLAPDYQAFLATRTIHGATVDRLPLKQFPSFPISVPPIEEQRALAKPLRLLDDKIELNRRMNETLEATAQAIFRDWFVDFGPVRRKLAGATDPVEIMGGVSADPARAAELAGLFPSGLDNNELPDGFEFVTLGDAVAVLETGTRPKGGIKGIDAGVPSIGAESILGLAKFDFSKTKYVPLEFFASMRRGIIGERDVLLYKDGGRPGEFEPHVAMFGGGFPFSQSCINEHVYRVVAADPFSQEFLYLHLTSEGSMEEMRNKGTGVAIPGLNSTAAKSLSILDPGAKLLAAFTSIVRPLVDAALHSASESRTLAETREYLLPRLMSGEVRVHAVPQEIAA